MPAHLTTPNPLFLYVIRRSRLNRILHRDGAEHVPRRYFRHQRNKPRRNRSTVSAFRRWVDNALPRSGTRSTRHHRLLTESLEPRQLLTGDVILSEFVASNDGTLTDQDGDSSDWIELMNVSREPVDLTGWHLTDDKDDLAKWTFPATTLGSGESLVVFASDKDRTNPANELHTNFKLATGGEFLALVEPDGQSIAHAYDPFPQQFVDVAYGVTTQTFVTELITPASDSKVHVPSATTDIPTTTWTAPTFDDASWITKDAAIGYSAGRLDTLVGPRGELSELVGNSTSAYIRIPFELDAAAPTYDELQLAINYDDGFIAYLNGTPVAARNAPEQLDANSVASEEHGGTIFSLDFPVLRDVVTFEHLGDSQLDGDVIRLTESEANESGAAWTNAPLPFGSRFSFSAFMEIDITQPGGLNDGDGPGGHGMTFVLQSGGKFRIGDNGGALGLDGAGMQFVAVEIDAQSDGAFDPDTSLPSHIGINSSLSGNHARVAVPTFNGSNSSNPRFVWVEYDGVTRTMDVYFSADAQQPTTPTLSALIDLQAIFEDSTTLWLGWTAANGEDAWNRHEVRDFRITSTSEPVFDTELLGLSEHAGLLRAGENVLAIHGMNVSADDEDFLIRPTLTATKHHYVDLANPGYFSVATPGAANGETSEPPSGAVRYSVTGRTFVDPFELTLSPPSPVAQIRYTLDGSIPDDQSTLYTGPMTINRSTRIRARAFEPGRAGGPVTSHGYIQLAADLVNFEGDVFDSNLPLMVFDSFGIDVHANAANLVPVSSVFFDNDEGRANLLDEPDFAGRAGLRIRGQSSQGWPKKQYALEIWDEGNSDRSAIPASRADDRAISIFDLPEESDWVLNGPYSDKTQLNNFLTFNWARAMGMYAPRTRLVEVFVKTNTGPLNYRTDYRGTYVLLEKIKIDPHRVDIAELSPGMTEEPDISGGYIWKYDKDGAGDVNFTTTFQSRTGSSRPWKFVEPQRPPTAQRNWLRNHLREFESALYGANFADPIDGYAKYIDVDSWIDTWLLVEFTKNIDGFRLSTYYHKDREGKIKQGPAWDYNLSLANANYLNGAYPTGWYHSSLGSGDYPYWDRLFQDPNFEIRVRDRWFELRRTLFSTENQMKHVDDAVSVLTDGSPSLGQVAPGEPSNPISRNFDRWNTLGTYLWPNCFFGTGGCPTSPLPNRGQPNSYDDYIFILKNFMEERAAWIDRQFRSPPDITPTDAQGMTTVEVSLERTSSGTIYYTVDGSDPRDPATGELAASAIVYQEPLLVNQNTMLQTRTMASGRWSALNSATYIVKIPKVTISELNYNPAAPTAAERSAGFGDNDAFEFVELLNFGADPVSLGGWRLEGGVEATLEESTLEPGQRAVVVRDVDAFRARYGNDAVIVGSYGDKTDDARDFKLRNSGEQLSLVGMLNETIVELAYEDRWYPLTDGDGFSLVRREPVTSDDPNDRSVWRPSELLLGSPGQAEPGIVPPPDAVIINEVIARSTGTSQDQIELRNTTDDTISVGSFVVVHDADRSIQYRVPANVQIPANGFFQLTQDQLGPNFRLSDTGGTLSLRGSLPDGTLTGFQDTVAYGVSLEGMSWGRLETSIGSDFALQTSVTSGEANAGPALGPVVFSEIQYHPAAGRAEFLELHNRTLTPVSVGAWELDGGIRYRFPAAEIPGGGYVVLLQVTSETAPDEAVAQFRITHEVPENVPVFVYTEVEHGSLDNGGETLVLRRPVSGTSLMVEVDRVSYSDEAPWISRPDGAGPSLSRISVNAYANDPANWKSSTLGGTPGRENIFEDATPPTAPTHLATAILPGGDVGLSWQPSLDVDSQVDHYAVYRGGRHVADTPIPFFRESLHWTEGQEFSYRVTAVNPDGFESGNSEAARVRVDSSSFQQGVDRYAGTLDSMIVEASPEENQGGTRRLSVDGNAMGTTGAASSAMLQWSDLSIPAEAELVSVSVTLNVVNSGDTFAIYPLLKNWVESEVTWNQAANGQPWQVPGALGSQDVGEAIGEVTTPTRGLNYVRLHAAGTEVVQAWLDHPESNHGFVIADPGGSTNNVSVDSQSAPTANSRPKLTLFHTTNKRRNFGDLNLDGELNADDIDLLHAALHHEIDDPHFDLDGDGELNSRDVDFLLEDLLGVLPGDANLDGVIGFADFLLLSSSFGSDRPTSWSSADFNGDGRTSFADFLLLSANFGKKVQE